MGQQMNFTKAELDFIPRLQRFVYKHGGGNATKDIVQEVCIAFLEKDKLEGDSQACCSLPSPKTCCATDDDANCHGIEKISLRTRAESSIRTPTQNQTIAWRASKRRLRSSTRSTRISSASTWSPSLKRKSPTGLESRTETSASGCIGRYDDCDRK